MTDNNLVITDIYNLKMAVIITDVFCSFRFIAFENGSPVPNVFCHFDFKLSEVEKNIIIWSLQIYMI